MSDQTRRRRPAVTAAAHRAAAEPGRSRRRRRAAAARRTAQVRAVDAAAVDAQHLDVPVTVEPVRHRPTARARCRAAAGRPDSAVDRVAAAAAAAAVGASSTAAATQRRLERAPELERHDVVQYRIDDGTDVVENAGRVEEDRLQRLAGGGALLDVVWTGVDGDKTLRVERRPADEKRNHHRHCPFTIKTSKTLI